MSGAPAVIEELPLTGREQRLLRRRAAESAAGIRGWQRGVVWLFFGALALVTLTHDTPRARWPAVLLCLAGGWLLDAFIRYYLRRRQRLDHAAAHGGKQVLHGRGGLLRAEGTRLLYQVGDRLRAVQPLLPAGRRASPHALADPVIRHVAALPGQALVLHHSAAGDVLLAAHYPDWVPEQEQLLPLPAPRGWRAWWLGHQAAQVLCLTGTVTEWIEAEWREGGQRFVGGRPIPSTTRARQLAARG
ncbi:MAG: hypothetical protein Q4G70_04220 [Pseudomonadota bacterium]|nr:hypothetical protein [Pseudomonadota bacterium]